MRSPAAAVIAATSLSLLACSPPAADKGADKAPATAAATGHTAEQARNLATFDDLDFNVYSGQKSDQFGRSPAERSIAHYPAGTTTTGLPAHIEGLKPQFVFAPDTRIKEHPVKLADGNFTAVQGIMEGTFTQPMDIGGGKVIQPTGKAFKLPMLTVGRWENGVMVEEWLYWDNQAFMKQVGLAP